MRDVKAAAATTPFALQYNTILQVTIYLWLLMKCGRCCCSFAVGTSRVSLCTNAVLLQRLQLLLLEAAAFLTERDELLVVAASTLLCSFSHSALRPVLPVFAKVPC